MLPAGSKIRHGKKSRVKGERDASREDVGHRWKRGSRDGGNRTGACPSSPDAVGSEFFGLASVRGESRCLFDSAARICGPGT